MLKYNLVSSPEIERRFGVGLRACPFCGSMFVALVLSFDPHVTCATCHADGPCFPGERATLEARQHEAVVKWNLAVR